MKTKDLTKREREVAILTCEGLSAKLVGKRLGLSTYTVQTHVYRIKRKMKAVNLVQACARFAVWGKSFEMHAIEQNERKQYAKHESEIQC